MSRTLRPVLLVVPAVLLAALLPVGGPLAPAAADQEAPQSGPVATNPAPNPAADWTPPPEPALTPVPVGPCPPKPTAGTATCLSRVDRHVPDARAARVGRADAIATSSSAGSSAGASADGNATAPPPLPDSAVPQAVTKSGSYSPADLASLYRIPASVTSGATVAIVDVGSDPNTAAQLDYYRRYFGLPACTTANGCFREVGQDGSGRLPAIAADWVPEIAMDVQAVSAICPTCHILLVDASSARASDLGAAALTAVRSGAHYVSMSYGSADSTQDAALNLQYYNAAGVTYVAASGDSGYAGGTIFPSSATNVVAAGGTSATLVSGHWQQSAWSGAGSGCASTGLLGVVGGLVQALLSGSSCPNGRAVTDVSALADADTGILFFQGGSWWSGGGTSLATPIITALYALAGNHTDPLAPYRNVAAAPGDFVDITAGRTGSCGTVLCTAGVGWDGPTGVGTPAGLAGLRASGTPAVPLARPDTAGALSATGSYPATLSYRLVDATTGAPVVGATVRIEAAGTGRGFAAAGSARTDARGTVRVAVRPHGPTAYRVLFDGDASHGASTSPTATVRVFTPHLSLRRTRHGLRVVAAGPWGGPAAGLPLTVQQRRHGGWHAVAHGRTSLRGRAAVALRGHHGAAYRVTYGGEGWSTGHSHRLRLPG